MVEVQLFPSGQLGDETEMIQNVRAGNLDIAVVGIANTVPFVKKLGILTMPYLFDDMYDIVRSTTGPAHDFLEPGADGPHLGIDGIAHAHFQDGFLISAGGEGAGEKGKRHHGGKQAFEHRILSLSI